MDKRQDRILGQCILIGLVWLGLHLYTFFINLFDSFYYTYDKQNFLCMALCAAHLIYFFCLMRRAGAKEKTDGPVDTGTGTME